MKLSVFETLTKEDQVAFLITERKALLAIEDEKNRVIEMQKALAEQEAKGQAEIEAVRVKVYKEKLALQQSFSQVTEEVK